MSYWLCRSISVSWKQQDVRYYSAQKDENWREFGGEDNKSSIITAVSSDESRPTQGSEQPAVLSANLETYAKTHFYFPLK